MSKKKLVKSKKTGNIKMKSIEEIEGEKVFDNHPDYIVLNGYVYEKHGLPEEGVNLALEFTDEDLALIKDFRKKNPGYINDAEFIRESLRNFVKNFNTLK